MAADSVCDGVRGREPLPRPLSEMSNFVKERGACSRWSLSVDRVGCAALRFLSSAVGCVRDVVTRRVDAAGNDRVVIGLISIISHFGNICSHSFSKWKCTWCRRWERGSGGPNGVYMLLRAKAWHHGQHRGGGRLRANTESVKGCSNMRIKP